MAGRSAGLAPRPWAPTVRGGFPIPITRRRFRTVPAVLPELLPELRDFGLERLVLIPYPLKQRVQPIEPGLLGDGRELLLGERLHRYRRHPGTAVVGVRSPFG